MLERACTLPTRRLTGHTHDRLGVAASPNGTEHPDRIPPQRMRRHAIAIALSAAFGTGLAAAQEETAPAVADTAEASPILLPEIQVEGSFRGERMDSPKYTRDLLDTPRIITILPQELLEDQNVTSLRDALRNVTGISIQAGEGNPPGGDQLKIRGFNARDDLNVNGARDLGNYFRDPFYVDQIEVVKGPNSAFSGRGSAGGTINFVTKRPTPTAFNEIELSGGTDEFVRATADINQPLSENSAFRLNLMAHSQDVPGRDVVFERRHGFYAAYTWGFTRDTIVTADYLHTRQNNLPDVGLPFDRETRNDRGAATGGLPPGISFSNFYGHLDDHQRIDVDQLGLTIEHAFTPDVALRNQFRYSLVDNDTISSSPRIRTRQPRDPENPGMGSLEGAFGIGDLKPRDQEDEAIFNQTDLLFSFETGEVRHDLVAGVEVGRFTQENRRRPDVSGNDQRVDLFNPDNRFRTRPAAPYDGSVHKLETEELGVYVLNSMEFNPQWFLDLGVRYDRVKATASERGHELGLDGSPTRENIEPLTRTDNEVSFNVGVVYKPSPESSFYAAFGQAFTPSATFDRDLVQLAGGARRPSADDPSQARPRDRAVADPDTFDIAPERTRAFEIGTKWDVFDSLQLGAALFRTDKTNARTPAIGQDDRVEVLDGKQRVQGFELTAAGRITPEWELFGGYTFLDSEVRESNNPFEVGQRLGGTPRHSFNVWTRYRVTPRFTIGGGVEFVSSQTSNIQPAPTEERIANEDRLIVSIPSYTVVDLSTSYRFSENAQLRVNAFNIFDEDYIQQMAEGGAQGIPGPGRHFIATFRYTF